MIDISNDNHFNKYKWKCKLVGINTEYTRTIIGIDSSNRSFYNDNYTDYWHNIHRFYALGSDGKLHYNDDGYAGEHHKKEWKNNDIIEMKLNIKNKTLEYFINGISDGIAYKDVCMESHKYYMRVTFDQKGSGIQLLEFTASN